jgi:hypothetical protein
LSGCTSLYINAKLFLKDGDVMTIFRRLFAHILLENQEDLRKAEKNISLKKCGYLPPLFY